MEKDKAKKLQQMMNNLDKVVKLRDSLLDAKTKTISEKRDNYEYMRNVLTTVGYVFEYMEEVYKMEFYNEILIAVTSYVDKQERSIHDLD